MIENLNVKEPHLTVTYEKLIVVMRDLQPSASSIVDCEKVDITLVIGEILALHDLLV